METYFRTLPMMCVDTYRSGNVEIWNNISSEVTHSRELGGSPMYSGDFKTPLPFNYNISDKGFYSGTFDVYSTSASHKKKGCSGFLILQRIPQLEVDAISTELVYNEALSRCNEKVRGSLDLSVALGESGKTVKMLRVINRLREAVRNLRRKPLAVHKTTANAWLEYNYGWRPLISDLYGAADESLRVVLNRIQNFKGSCTKNEQWEKDLNLIAQSVLGDSYFQTRALHQYKTGVRFQLRLENPAIDLARWTSLNPLSIAWELTPYSFVADWFIDIGSFLRDTETALLYSNRFKSGFYTILRANKVQVRCNTTGRNSHGSVYYGNFDGWNSEITFQRTLLNGYPLPTYPRFKADLSSRRLLSAAALLTQKLRR